MRKWKIINITLLRIEIKMRKANNFYGYINASDERNISNRNYYEKG